MFWINRGRCIGHNVTLYYLNSTGNSRQHFGLKIELFKQIIGNY